MRTWAIKKGEVEPDKEQRTQGLLRMQPFGCRHVLVMLLVNPAEKRGLGSPEPVSPLPQGELYDQ